MDRTYYAIYSFGEKEPDGLFYKYDDGERMDLVGYHRGEGTWKPQPDLLDLFVGRASGERKVEISPAKAALLARKFGTSLPRD